MERNLRSRVEVVFPVYDDACKAEIFSFINLQLAPYRKTRLIDQNLKSITIPPESVCGDDTQEAFYQLMQNK
jgi:polyphosphate kinase